jgi:hypothetical protein
MLTVCLSDKPADCRRLEVAAAILAEVMIDVIGDGSLVADETETSSLTMLPVLAEA